MRGNDYIHEGIDLELYIKKAKDIPLELSGLTSSSRSLTLDRMGIQMRNSVDRLNMAIIALLQK